MKLIININSMKNVLHAVLVLFMMSAISCNKDDDKVTEDTKAGVYLKESSSLGKYLADEKGMTLYFFTKDIMGESMCTEGCLDNWPIYYNADMAVGEGIEKSDFATITRADGKMQNSYKGWPLYYFINDIDMGDTNGEAVNGVWFVAKTDYVVMFANAQLVGADGKNYMADYTEGEGMTQFMVNMDGVTLYSFKKDTENKNNFTNGDAEHDAIWPIASLDMMNMSIPSNLDKADFAEIEVLGKKQTTYKGWPLYYFSKDSEEKGSTKGVSVPMPGIWPIVNLDSPMPNPTPTATEIAEAYFNDELKTVIDNRCTTCHGGYHSQENSSKYANFTNAMAKAGGMYNQVNSGGMPKGGAKLAQNEIDMFKKFSDLVSDIN